MLGREIYTVSFKVFIGAKREKLVASIVEGIDKIFGFVSDESVTIHQIVCATKLHKRTVKRYLSIIARIQNSEKIIKEIQGSRVVFRKER